MAIGRPLTSPNGKRNEATSAAPARPRPAAANLPAAPFRSVPCGGTLARHGQFPPLSLVTRCDFHTRVQKKQNLPAYSPQAQAATSPAEADDMCAGLFAAPAPAAAADPRARVRG